MTINPFIFNSYHFDLEKGTLLLDYVFDKWTFQEKILFPLPFSRLSNEALQALDRCFFLLHIACGISYYKAFNNPPIQIKSGVLTKDQASFFNDFYQYGLAQYAYLNNLSLKFRFPFDESLIQKPFQISLSKGIFVPVGGGKDSCVSIELLKKAHFTPMLISINSARPIEECEKKSFLESLTITRKISDTLLKNKDIFLNGHVPITGILAFILMTACLLYDKRFVVMSCESSADETNIAQVNHQWSKSSIFEKSFAKITQNILPDFRYFSLLRPFTEMHIAKLFATYCQNYFDVFTSCNHAFHINENKRLSSWCGSCDKCRFVFLILAPFIEKEKLVQIVGRNPLNDKNQLQGYKELLGLSGIKPFECVGTFSESRLAFSLIKNKPNYCNDFIVKELSSQIVLTDETKQLEEILKLKENHLIPLEFLQCLKIKI